MSKRYAADYIPSGVDANSNNFETVFAETLDEVIVKGKALNSICHDECYNIVLQRENDWHLWETVAYYDIEGNEI